MVTILCNQCWKYKKHRYKIYIYIYHIFTRIQILKNKNINTVIMSIKNTIIFHFQGLCTYIYDSYYYASLLSILSNIYIYIKKKQIFCYLNKQMKMQIHRESSLVT